MVHVQDKILFSHKSHSAVPATGLELGISMLNKINQVQKDKWLIIHTYVQSEKELEVLVRYYMVG